MSDHPHGAGPVVVAPCHRGRREHAWHIPLIRVDLGGEQQRQLAQGGELPGQEMLEQRLVGGKHVRAVRSHERHVNVAGAAFSLVELRHEGDRHALLGGDLLRAELVDRVVVAGAHRGAVSEVDLVLTEVALALRAFHVHPRAFHRGADPADERLDVGRVEQRVVDAVRGGLGQVPIAGIPRLAVRAAEDHEFELGADLRRQTTPGQAPELRAQDLPRRDGNRLTRLLERVGQHQRGAWMPGHQSERREVGFELEVSEASVPTGQAVALLRRHVDIGGQQVLA